MSHFKKLLASALSALIISSTVFLYETHQSFQSRKTLYLNWAQQLRSQLEHLAQRATEKGEPNPIQWAVETLKSPSKDPLFQIDLVRQIEGTLPKESYSFEAEQGVFRLDHSLDHSIDSDLNYTVRILIKTPYQGFLGASNRLYQEVALIILFLLLFGQFFLLLNTLFPEHCQSNLKGELPFRIGDSSRQSMTKKLRVGITKSKTLLLSMGNHTKENTQGLYQLIKNTAGFQDHLSKIQDQLFQAYTCVIKTEAQILTPNPADPISTNQLSQIKTHLHEVHDQLHQIQLNSMDTLRCTDQINTSISLMRHDLDEQAQTIEDLDQEVKRSGGC